MNLILNVSITERAIHIKYMCCCCLENSIWLLWNHQLMGSPLTVTAGLIQMSWLSQSIQNLCCLVVIDVFKRCWTSVPSYLYDMVMMRLWTDISQCKTAALRKRVAPPSCFVGYWLSLSLSRDVQASEWSTGKEANLLEWRLCPAAAVWSRRESTRSSIHPSIHPSIHRCKLSSHTHITRHARGTQQRRRRGGVHQLVRVSAPVN